MPVRTIKKIYKTREMREGAGVLLHRAFGLAEVPHLDPFLMLDDFSSGNPNDYSAGFPWHPHRGIETVTYMLGGEVEHVDSMGNKGVVESGAVQWMTAGSGIIHQEMPNPKIAPIAGFQLWVNLPKKEKMMSPRYQDILPGQIKTVSYNGADVKVIAGNFRDVRGPIADLMVDPLYLDVFLESGRTFECNLRESDTAFLYVFQGTAASNLDFSPIASGSVALLSSGDVIKIHAPNESVRFLLISGTPLGEPIAWHGPIVMNTNEELKKAFSELNSGTFIKKS